MKKYLAALLLTALLVLTGCGARSIEKLTLPETFSMTLPDDAAYLITGSDMLSSIGDINVFDKDGTQVHHSAAKIMSLSWIARTSDDAVCLAGDRGNSNLYIHDGKVENFYLLDNPQYTGSLAASMDEQRMYAAMNGNTSEETGYECLLVARDRKTGDTAYQTIVPLFVNGMLDHEGKLYIVGDNLGPEHREAVIVIVDKQTGQIEYTGIHEEYGNFRHITVLNGEIFVVVSDKDYTVEELMKFKDGEFHHLTKHYKDERINQITADDKYLYVHSGITIVQVTSEGDVVSRMSHTNSEAYFLSMEVEDDLVYLYTIEKTEDTTRTVRMGVYERSGLELKKQMLFEVPYNDIIRVVRLPQW